LFARVIDGLGTVALHEKKEKLPCSRVVKEPVEPSLHRGACGKFFPDVVEEAAGREVVVGELKKLLDLRFFESRFHKCFLIKQI
jgi:hypothetical protein